MTTTTAVKKAPPGRQQGRTPGTASPGAGGQGAAQQPVQPDGNPASSKRLSRRGQVPLTPMRREAAKRIRVLAAQVQKSHPDMSVHDHLRDAARVLESGNEEGAQRHLRAAAFALSPQSLMRNGLHADEHHIAARGAVHGVHRHLLLVKDIQDAAARNQQAIARDSYGDDSTAPPCPDPNAGYGPGALAQKPTARQPPGDQAMNAPSRSSSGGSDPNAADPDGPQPRGSKQFAYGWDDLARVVELVGPKGWEHNWHYVGGPGLPSPASRKAAAKGAPARPRMVATGRPATAGSSSGILSGPHPADRLTVASDPKATARAMTDDDLQRADVELSRRATLLGKAGQKSRAHKAAVAEMQRRGVSMSVTWDDLDVVLEFSAKTAALERTPAPIGKPGGPGLYHVKGLGHSDYFQQVRNGLMKRGVPEGKAHAMTWGILRRWAAGGGHVHPEVQAAAARALAGEAAAAAKAHAHAVTWDDIGAAIELGARGSDGASWDDIARAVELAAPPFNAALHPRAPAGAANGGQFAAGGAGTGTAQGQQGQGKQPAQPKPTAHQLHVLHVAHVNGVSTQKAELQVAAQDDRQKAAALIKQRDALVAALASAGGKVSKGQAGAKTASTAKTKSTAPAKSTAGAAPAKTSSAAPAKSAKAPAKAAGTKGASATAAAPKAGSAAAAKAQIAALNIQISALLAQAAQAEAQAAKMN